MKQLLLFICFFYTCLRLHTQPHIDSVSPHSGNAGTTITIKGNNFNTSLSKNKVFFGAEQGIITSLTQTKITATAPLSATYQPLTILSDSLVGYARNPFIQTYNCVNNIQPDFFSNEFKFTAHVYNMLIDDFDNDGKTDIMSIDFSGVDVYKNNCSSNSLSFSPIIIPTYAYPNYIASGDLNGDGKPDLVVTYTSVGDNISVYENTSQNAQVSFGPMQVATVGVYNYGQQQVCIKDINNDGKPDVIVATENKFVVLPNNSVNGNISFGNKIDLFRSITDLGRTRLYTNSITDLDGDGKQDIITYYYNSDSTITIFKNAGTNGVVSFSDTINIAVGAGITDIIVGDFNNDDKPDIALLNQSTNVISILKNNSSAGAISFSKATNLQALPGLTAISTSDINGDGKCELIAGETTSNTNTISVYTNQTSNGSIAFSGRIDYNMGAGTSTLAVADVNLDTKPDIISCNTNDKTISIFQTQTPPVIDSFNPATARSGDTISIYGSSLKNVIAVNFGGKPASYFNSLSSNLIRAVVGDEKSGNVVVKTIYGSDTVPGFHIAKDSVAPAAPVITSFSPTSGNTGTTVTITGKNFANGAANNIVFFGDVRGTILSASSTQIKAVVPKGSNYKPVSVSKVYNGLTGYSANPFVVTFPDGAAINKNSFDDSSVIVSNDEFNGLEYCDFDNDGKLDLVVSSTAGYSSVYRNISTTHKPQFSASPVYTIGYASGKFVTTDLDGDGKKDVINLIGNGGISVFKNTSTFAAISFDVRHDFYAANFIDNIEAADIDGDGKTDIVAIFDDNRFAVLKNTTANGVISFDIQVNFINVYNQNGLAIADVNGDNKPDVSITDFSNHVSVFINKSDFLQIDFNAAKKYVTASDPRNIAFGDLNNDTKPDMVVTNFEGNNISVFENTTSSVNNLSFAAKKNFATYSGCRELTINDFDGDGLADIAVCPQDSVISVFRNKSTSSLISFVRTDFYDASHPFKIKAADLDNDGKADLSFINNYLQNISVLRNIDNEPFVESITPDAGSSGTVVTIKGNNFTNATAVKFGSYNAASFTIQSPTTIIATVGNNVPADNLAVTVSNIYGTGTLNAFYTGITISSVTPAAATVGSTVTIKGTNFNNNNSKNIIFFGAVRAKNILSASDSVITVTLPYGATYAPVTVSSDSLIAFSAKSFSVKFDGDSVFNAKSFSKKTNYALGHHSGFTTCVGDINGDGKPDILAGSNSNYLSFYKNISDTATIKFDAVKDFSLSSSLRNIITADLNGDGKPDVIGSDYNHLIILKNKSTVSNISFASEKDYYGFADGSGLAVGDLDNDGRPDIVTLDNSFNTLSVIQNISRKGEINFGNKKVYATGNGSFAYPLSVCIADFDKDGKKDIAVCNSGSTSNSISVFRNISTRAEIKFEAKKDIIVNATPWAIAAGDIDNDGLVDIAIANNLYPGNVSVLKNKSTRGSISFNNHVDFITGNNPQAIALADMNGDGSVDIVTADINDVNAVSVLRNKSTNNKISFANSVHYAKGNSVHVSLGDLNADARPEIVFMNYVPDSITILKNGANQFLKPVKENNIYAEKKILDNGSKVTLYPNPVEDVLYIDGLDATSANYLEIINSDGKIIASSFAKSDSYRWNIKNLSAGIYFLVIKTNNASHTISFYKD